MTTIATTARPLARFGVGGDLWRIGGMAAVVSLYLALVGIVSVFHKTPLVDGVVSLGESALILTALTAGFAAARRTSHSVRGAVLNGAIVGALGGSSLSALIVIGQFIDLRAVLLQASPELYSLLSFGLGLGGFWVPIAFGGLMGALGGAGEAARPNLRRSLLIGIIALLVLGTFAGLVRTPLLASPLSDMGRAMFASGGGLTLAGAIVTLGGAVANDLGARLGGRFRARRGGQVGAVLGVILLGLIGATYGAFIGTSVSGGTLIFGALGALVMSVLGLVVGSLVGIFVQRTVARGEIGQRVEALPERQQRIMRMAIRVAMLLIGLLLVLWLPIAVGSFFAQVVVLVAMYVLMGLGLNITLGLAGLLDLGFVAFFAVGALHRGPADVDRRVRHRPVAVLAGGAICRFVRDGVRRLPGAAHPGYPRRLPGHRDARLRRDRAHPRRYPT